MRDLLGYHSQNWFAGDLKNRRKQLSFGFDDQILESDVELIGGVGYSASEENRVNQRSTKDDFQYDAEKYKMNVTKIQSEILGGEE